MIQRGLKGQAFRETLKHELVHRALTPLSGPLRGARATARIWGYQNSHLLRYLEEAIAETVGTGSLARGLRFPLQAGYGLAVDRILLEAGGYFAGVGLLAYFAYGMADSD